MTWMKSAVRGVMPLGKFGNYLLTRTAVSFLKSVEGHLYWRSSVDYLSTFALLVSTARVQLLAELHLLRSELCFCIVTTASLYICNRYNLGSSRL